MQDKIEWARKMESGSRCRLSNAIVSAYKVRAFRKICLWLAAKLEGGQFFSASLREVLSRYHGVKIGKYSYGACLEPGVLPKGTIVGAYCSFAAGLTVLRRNHPVSGLSQHPFFYNSALGLLEKDAIPAIDENPLNVGTDVWIGDGVTILPRCKTIGDGAIVGAGSIVTKDVEAYTIVAGNPARLIARRFPGSVEDYLRSIRWWELTLHELIGAYGDIERALRSAQSKHSIGMDTGI